MNYQEFLKKNRQHVNYVLNKVVFACLLAGIGIFIGTALHLWNNISYSSAIIQMILVIVVSLLMYIFNKKFSQTYLPSVVGLLSLGLVLSYSANMHIGIYLSYFLVPLLAIAFCDRIFFLIICGLNYICMFLTVFKISSYYGVMSLTSLNSDNPALKWFISHITGYTLEYICMTIAGYAICKRITRHMKDLYDYQSQSIRQFKVMGSATNIFQEIFYINNTSQTYVVNRKDGFDYIGKEDLEKSLNAIMQKLVPADGKRFEEFTDLTTISDRMRGRNSIEDIFYSLENGYFNAMIIAVSGEEENADEYIFCTRDINEEKARERTLNEMARRDQPTSLLNRRAYEEDFAAFVNAQNHELAIVVVDINGLKAANDSMGHLAGDELILAVAGLLIKYFEDIGNVYRVGGDEFHILVRNEQLNIIEERISSMKSETKNWKGKLQDSLSISIGFASAQENQDLDLKKVQKLADKRMYEDKSRYYAANPDLDRRSTTPL